MWAYVVGMDEDNPNDIVDCTNNFKTIHEALQDYFDKKWDKRTYYFIAMISNAEIGKNTITYDKDNLIKQCSEKFNDFARWYLGNRMKDKSSGGIEDFAKASNHFKPASEEIASIFIEGLRHVIKNPQDMITARTDPDPKPAEESTSSKVFNKTQDLIKKAEKQTKKIKEKLDQIIRKYK